MESDAKYYITALDEWLMKHIITCNVQRDVRTHYTNCLRKSRTLELRCYRRNYWIFEFL